MDCRCHCCLDPVFVYIVVNSNTLCNHLFPVPIGHVIGRKWGHGFNLVWMHTQQADFYVSYFLMFFIIYLSLLSVLSIGIWWFPYLFYYLVYQLELLISLFVHFVVLLVFYFIFYFFYYYYFLMSYSVSSNKLVLVYTVGQISVVQALLEELPGQFLTYMRGRDIKPRPLHVALASAWEHFPSPQDVQTCWFCSQQLKVLKGLNH